jgi:predicted transposase YdaD
MREVINMKSGTLTIEDVLRETGYIPRWEEMGKEKGKEEKALEIAKNLVQKGWKAEEVAETTDLPLDKIKPLYKP